MCVFIFRQHTLFYFNSLFYLIKLNTRAKNIQITTGIPHLFLNETGGLKIRQPCDKAAYD